MKIFSALLGVVCTICVVSNTSPAGELQKSAIEKFQSVQQDGDRRISLLSITKGVAFLDSQKLIADGWRPHGENMVPWMQVAVAIEQLSDKSEPMGFDVETPDGKELVGKLKVEMDGHVITSRSRGITELDSDSPQIRRATFPSKPPASIQTRDPKVFLFTMSGKFQETETVTLRFWFGDKKDRRELVFKDVPTP